MKIKVRNRNNTEDLETKIGVEDVKNNILKRINKHKKDISFWKQQLALSKSVTGSEECVRNIKSSQERKSELEMVLNHCFNKD